MKEEIFGFVCLPKIIKNKSIFTINGDMNEELPH
jgi:hypothetical protein